MIVISTVIPELNECSFLFHEMLSRSISYSDKQCDYSYNFLESLNSLSKLCMHGVRRKDKIMKKIFTYCQNDEAMVEIYNYIVLLTFQSDIHDLMRNFWDTFTSLENYFQEHSAVAM